MNRKDITRHKKRKKNKLQLLFWGILFAFVAVLVMYLFSLGGKSIGEILRCTELEIVSQYNAELRGICNYYSIASNYNILNYFSYLMEYSCLKTLAHKLRSNCGKVKVKYKDGNGKWGIPYETKTGKKRCYLVKHSDCRNVTIASDNLPNTSKMLHGYIGTTLERRLSAKVCELCGTSKAEYYEIHHVNKVKNLKGKALWEKVMIAKRRKTIVLCKSCHDKIHNRSSHND